MISSVIRVGRVGRVAVAATVLLGLGACGDAGGEAAVTTVNIRPSSYEVKDPVVETTVPAVPAPGADGRSVAEQTYTIQSNQDVPYNIAAKFDISLEELRNYNGWDEDYSQWPGIGGVVRIPPNAKFVDPAATTTTIAPPTQDGGATETSAPDGGSTEEAGGDRCNPTYTVEAGDAPLVITRKFDVTLDQLNAANVGTPDWPNLYPGRVIKLPPPADCAG